MNNERRKTLSKIVEDIRKHAGIFPQIAADLEDLKSEEQEAFDNMPESLQNGERGQQMQENINQMESAIDSLGVDFDEIASDLEGSVQ